ncbi:hypothetical protein [Basfia succiniciproducens]|uniref:hypothetical protein n=1 Tax=Basfia succiniciproducens TaxID=653940 RepID=UPI003FCCC8A5
MKFVKNRAKEVNVGIYGIVRDGKQQLDVVWLDERDKVYQEKQLLPAAYSQYEMISLIHKSLGYERLNAKFISVISPHHIWSRSLFLPTILTHQECEQQCAYTLQNELPVPLDSVFYDYSATEVAEGTYLKIYAVMQKVAQEQVAGCAPYHINILDNAALAIKRAFNFIIPEDFPEDTLFLYRDESISLAIQTKTEIEQRILQLNQTGLSDLYTVFCRRYNEQPAHCYAYSNIERRDSPHWRLVETPYPFMALGAALWSAEERKKEESEKTAESLH